VINNGQVWCTLGVAGVMCTCRVSISLRVLIIRVAVRSARGVILYLLWHRTVNKLDVIVHHVNSPDDQRHRAPGCGRSSDLAVAEWQLLETWQRSTISLSITTPQSRVVTIYSNFAMTVAPAHLSELVL